MVISPSTLASNIAALICAACLFRERRDKATATFLEEYADFLNSHVESWTVTTQGALVPGISRHYIRILPESVDNPRPEEDPNRGVLNIANRPPEVQNKFPSKDIVDAGFLELVRYGIRQPDDSLIVDSLRVVDAVLQIETPFGPCWHRYNNDGYGQKEDGGPFVSWGKGRGWPLLAGERGHYELAAGHGTRLFIQAMEGFSSATGLLPEQVWDDVDRPERYMLTGRPTGSAMPLMWAHSEYIKLLRSVADGQVFDLIPEVAGRYLSGRNARHLFEVWKQNRQVRRIRKGYTLRIQIDAPFRLHWTSDEWHTVKDTPSVGTTLGIDFVDVPIPAEQRAPIQFTFFWMTNRSWEGRDYLVEVES